MSSFPNSQSQCKVHFYVPNIRLSPTTAENQAPPRRVRVGGRGQVFVELVLMVSSYVRGLVIGGFLRWSVFTVAVRAHPSRPSTMITNTGVRSIIFFSMSMMSSWSFAPSMNSSRVSSPVEGRVVVITGNGS